MKKRFIFSGIGIIALSAFAILTWMENRTLSTPKQTIYAHQDIINRGQYLAKVGDCASCHTANDGAELAGGYPMSTPFGLLYSGNITPSVDYGIGRWTADDFYKAMTEGIAPPSRHLYPAMPYTYFNHVTRSDSDALYAYLMTLPAIDAPPLDNQLGFPFNQRMLLMGWNLLFFDHTPLPSVSVGNSEAWQRGEYIVNTLGHCAMCHSPMGDFGELKRDQILQGGILGRFAAPALTPQALAERGWNQTDLDQYLSTGIAEQGSAFSDMYPVIHNSTQFMTDDDIHAISTYLMGDQPLPAKEVTIAQGNAEGQSMYLELCSGCHNLDGTGKPNVAIAMVNNSTVRNPDPHNLIVAILDGLPWQTFPNDERFQSMPAFAKDITNEQMANLVNYLRATWGGLPEDVTTADIEKLRL